jgi:polysaccharide pyruvyl transferase WcaK-like protein
VTARRSSGTRHRSVPRVGLFGILGAGNIGNDASMESVLRYLQAGHPDAIVDAMCSGPEWVKSHHGIEAVPMAWSQTLDERASGVTWTALKMLSKGVDAVRTASWVRKHDVVIVPGMGVLDASLPLRAWQFPYALFLISASGRLFRTRVAMVSVGADIVHQGPTRWLLKTAARLAFFRSFRDAYSREAMRRMGLDVARDPVFPDLVFGLPAPSHDVGDPQTVAVGVMAYYGSNDDRGEADAIYASYIANVTRFVRWLVDGGRKVRLLIGDANGSDDGAVQDILASLRVQRPDLESSQVVAQPMSSLADVMRELAMAGTVVATRYHNVLCGLRLSRPTISLGYSAKHEALMAEMGVPEFCQAANPLDVDMLIKRFAELESRSTRIRQVLQDRNLVSEQRLDEQFAALSALLFPAREPSPTMEQPHLCQG